MPGAVVSVRAISEIDKTIVVIERSALILPQWTERQLSAAASISCARYRCGDIDRAVRLLCARDDVDGVQSREVRAILLGVRHHIHRVRCRIDGPRARDANRRSNVGGTRV